MLHSTKGQFDSYCASQEDSVGLSDCVCSLKCSNSLPILNILSLPSYHIKPYQSLTTGFLTYLISNCAGKQRADPSKNYANVSHLQDKTQCKSTVGTEVSVTSSQNKQYVPWFITQENNDQKFGKLLNQFNERRTEPQSECIWNSMAVS